MRGWRIPSDRPENEKIAVMVHLEDAVSGELHFQRWIWARNSVNKPDNIGQIRADKLRFCIQWVD